ncbi:uncharacterized protein LOC135832015 isoform X2 [Planococcus citri]|uniref:uncharacterized protein LOC135832015 isoform X2 n=1 Tax=Planococcus citri TaxID=170843 RepID=UPI0031F9E937
MGEEIFSGGKLVDKITSLEEAQKIIKQLQNKLRAQSHQFLAWHRKFKSQEDVIAHIVQDRNDQLKSLSCKLILFEAKLYRKQKEIANLLVQREIIINKQQHVIKTLQNQLSDAGLKYDEDTNLDTANDSDSAVIMEDDENFVYHQPHTGDGITIVRSISDVLQQPNSCKLLTLRRSNGYLRRPEVLETVYSVEEDADTDGASSPTTQTSDEKDDNANVRKPQTRIYYTKDRANKIHGSVERLDDEKKPEPTHHVTAYNRVMSNHRSVTKPKDVKYKRINKAKSKSLEELRGRLKNWVEKSNRFTFSFEQS